MTTAESAPAELSAYDGIPSRESANGKELFRGPHVVNVELPLEGATQNFDIPAKPAR